jgi:endonuclease YncB( thermonuclease family)
MVLLAVVVSATGGSFAWAQESLACDHDQQTFRCVGFIRNYDADTVTVKIPNVHPLLGDQITVRVRGVDAPEMRGKSPCERDAALRGKEFVALELQKAKRIDLSDVGRDKYFRILANVLYDGRDLALELKRRGLAKDYAGGKKSPGDWCAVPLK